MRSTRVGIAKQWAIENADRIADLITTGVARGALSALHDALAGADLLLIDDLHRIDGMERTQQELATIVERMIAESRQVVFSSRNATSELLSPSMRHLLLRSILIDLEPIGPAGREAIVRRLLAEMEVAVGDDVIGALVDATPGRP